MHLEPVERIDAGRFHDVARELEARERPLVIVGGIAAAADWSVEKFRDTFGALEIPVRDTDDEFQVFFSPEPPRSGRRPRVAVSEYLDLTQADRAGERPPYAGNISIFKDPRLAGKFERLVADCHFPEWSRLYTNDEYRLWLGAAGQRSTIHNDTYHNFNAQLIGSKRFLMLAPDQHPLLYPTFFHPGLWASPIDPKQPDLERYPDFARARGVDCVLTAGDMLVIPRFWWHYVEALSFAVNVNRWVSSEPGTEMYWHQQPAARALVSFESILDRVRQRFDSLPADRQRSYRGEFDAFQDDLLRLMVRPA